ncbi:MAG: UbiA family prenyltransferase, partial [Sphingobacteriaceae bacterium]
PPLIGYFAAFDNPQISWIPIILFLIQFVWQFPHFWAIAWVLDDDYKKAGFMLLPTKKRDKVSALFTLVSTIILLPVSLLPTIMGFGGYVIGAISLVASLIFCWFAFNLYKKLDISSAQKVMFGSFAYLPLVQLVLLFDFVG